MKKARRAQAAPADLSGRVFVGADGKRYAALWWSPDEADEPTLTCAEREVARMILAGWSNAAIAEARGVSVSTIANQASAVFAKLRVAGRAELVARLMGPGK